MLKIKKVINATKAAVAPMIAYGLGPGLVFAAVYGLLVFCLVLVGDDI